MLAFSKLFLFLSFTAQSVPLAGSNCEGSAAAQNCSETKCKVMNKTLKSEDLGGMCAVQGMASSRVCGPVYPQGSVGSAEKASSRVWLLALRWDPAGSDFVPEAKGHCSHQIEVPQLREVTLLPLPNCCLWSFHLKPVLLKAFCMMSEISHNSSKKKIPSKISTLKKMKSYKQKLLNSSPSSLMKPWGAVLLQQGDMHRVLPGVPGWVIAWWRQPCQPLPLQFLLWCFSANRNTPISCSV